VSRRTIARPVSLEGQGLHEGRPTRLALKPAEAGGVRFRRTDLPGADAVPALVSAREERPRRTAIVAGRAEVHTVEHLLAAVAGLGLTDLEVEIDQIEVPGLDGSAARFLDALREAGARDLSGEAPRLALDRVVEVADAGGARIVAVPCRGRLVLEYVLDYAADLPRTRVALELTEESFARELAPARTFCLAREADALRAAGLGKGATFENTLVIGGDGLPIDNTLRFPDEYARHKALDLFGDLALLGARLEARVFAYKAGHSLNAALVRKLAAILAEGPAEPAPARVGPADPPLVAPGGGPFAPPAVAFDGHFPSFPVLPGVVSVAAIAGAAGRGRVASIENARFRRIARPGERLSVTLGTPAADGRVRGAVRSAEPGAVVAEATLLFTEAAEGR
jgi:UDP-3-O-acyl N-acetylglucosamine deacetylase